MKKTLAILLMLVLPMQFAFAVAATYCEGEVATTSKHYGHHEHDIAQALAKSDTSDNQLGHAECGVCHLGCAKFFSATLTVGMLVSELPVHASVLLAAAQFQPSPLQRPPIASLA